VGFSEGSAVPQEELDVEGKRFVYHRGIPDYEKANDGPRLVVLNDLLHKASRDVCDLFRKGSHQRNTSVILITHYGRCSREKSF
jgi:hypothetical protein